MKRLLSLFVAATGLSALGALAFSPATAFA